MVGRTTIVDLIIYCIVLSGGENAGITLYNIDLCNPCSSMLFMGCIVDP